MEFQDIKIYNKHITDYKRSDTIIGREGFSLTKYYDEKTSFYLKHSDRKPAERLNHEYLALRYLADNYARAPIPLYFSQTSEQSTLVISTLAGEQSQRMTSQFSKEQIISMVAKELRSIHSLKITELPLELNSVETNELEHIRFNIKNNRINLEDFEESTGISVIAAYDELTQLFHNLDLTSFTHGDYCLPNILITANSNIGVVDWTQAGLSDIHKDFSAIEGSISRNFGNEYVPEFYKAYAYPQDKVDVNKIRYYKLTDQFTYNFKDPY